MLERIRNVLVQLNVYRTKYPHDRSIEQVMEQLELIQFHMETEKPLTIQQKEALNFNSVANTPLENDEKLATELQSIRNFAAHSL